MGYIGLSLALVMHRADHDVVGVDIASETVERLRDGQTRVSDVDNTEIADSLAEGIEFTTKYAALSDVDGVSICVPTPLRKTDTPALSFVVDASEQLASVIHEGATVILESTGYPGATEEVVGDALTTNAATVGEDIQLAFSPYVSTPATKNTPRLTFQRSSAASQRTPAITRKHFTSLFSTRLYGSTPRPKRNQ